MKYSSWQITPWLCVSIASARSPTVEFSETRHHLAALIPSIASCMRCSVSRFRAVHVPHNAARTLQFRREYWRWRRQAVDTWLPVPDRVGCSLLACRHRRVVYSVAGRIAIESARGSSNARETNIDAKSKASYRDESCADGRLQSSPSRSKDCQSHAWIPTGHHPSQRCF